MTKYQASKPAGPGATVVAATRKGIWQFEQTTSSQALGAAGTVVCRRRCQIPQVVTRWRLHIRNFAYLFQANPAGSLTNFQVAYGEAADSTTQYHTGACKTALTQLQSGGSNINATLTGGNEIISDWVSASTYQIGNYKQTFFSFMFTVGSSDAIAFGGGEQWYSVNVTADFLNAAMSAPTRASSQGFLNLYIEYEHADATAPTILNLGNSLSGGGNGANPNYENRGELDSWGGQWLLHNNGVYATLSVAGGWAADFATASGKWNYYNTLDTTVPFAPDAITMVAFDSSDLIGTNSPAVWASTLLTNALLYTGQAVAKVKSMYPNARIIATNNPARVASIGDGTSTSVNSVERDRITHNDWWMSSPLGIDTCVDINDLAIDRTTGPPLTTPARLLAEYSPDGTHGKPNYYSKIAERIGAAINRRGKV